MARASIHGSFVHGEADDCSENRTHGSVHAHDVNAPIPTRLGSEQHRLGVNHQGLDVRLTGIDDGNPIQAILDSSPRILLTTPRETLKITHMKGRKALLSSSLRQFSRSSRASLRGPVVGGVP